MGRFTLLAVAVMALVGAPSARGQATDEVKQLKLQVELLQAKLEAATLKIEKLEKENRQLKVGGKTSTTKKQTRSLSDRLSAGTIVTGDFVTTNMGKNNYRGKATLTVSERTMSRFKAKFLARGDGKPDFEFEVAGTITGDSLTAKSVNAPNPFTLTGRQRDGYLTLQFSAPYTKARVTLKVD